MDNSPLWLFTTPPMADCCQCFISIWLTVNNALFCWLLMMLQPANCCWFPIWLFVDNGQFFCLLTMPHKKITDDLHLADCWQCPIGLIVANNPSTWPLQSGWLFTTPHPADCCQLPIWLIVDDAPSSWLLKIPISADCWQCPIWLIVDDAPSGWLQRWKGYERVNNVCVKL